MTPVLLGLTLITFLLTYVVPGDPVDLIAKQEYLTPQTRAALRHQLGLDVPLPVQYTRYIGRLLHGDLGRSYVTNIRVTEAIASAFPITLRLGLAAFVLSTVVGVGAGILAGCRPHTWLDRVMTVLTLAGISMPVIWVAPLAILLFAVTLRIFPPSGYDGWFSLVLPALVLGVSAAFFVEFIFAIPGMGRLALDAVAQRDLFMIQGTVLVAAVVYILANLSVDVSYAYLDPRIRYA